MRNLLPICSLLLAGLLCACSAIDIQKLEPDDLDIKINVIQQDNKTDLDVFLSRGIWNQPVKMNGAVIEAGFANGNSSSLVAANKKGRYGVRLNDASDIVSVYVETIGQVSLPTMPPVRFSPENTFEGQSFFKEDVLSLHLPEAESDTRYLVATGHCGNNSYKTELNISVRETTMELSLRDIMSRINSVAEAYLNGIIPITLALEERYQPKWPAPFEVGKIASRDETHFQIDTAEFRFSANVAVKLSTKNLLLGFQSQPWPIKHCF